ncbi:hypothetical protein FVEN_g1776 [Fusarium venenatum]|uniref:Uncharacterized protein n=1 Tax=Fusarium venenatum TaxID=56646 RepID=A0A2L2T2F7_9HYPO|nr:uncharacterized protein FVRRES_12984 [Fusarium venenatum]KAG8360699.1 hypothetical protein FVEN_g1776 [Fusarium venenatum]KAH6979554.1 hypothetical protein EDB82DRAFT_527634 [Fusarium venenatum]CEI40293.1 unnamed protein product [Fusarium venenatum]
MAASNHSSASNKCTWGSSGTRALSPRPDPTGAGDHDTNALNGLHHAKYPPPNTNDLGNELDNIYDESEKLPAQMQHGLPDQEQTKK